MRWMQLMNLHPSDHLQPAKIETNTIMSISTKMPEVTESSPATSGATPRNNTDYTQEELEAILENYSERGWIDFGQYFTIREAEVIHAASNGREELPWMEEFLRNFMEEAAEKIVKYREDFHRKNETTETRSEREDSVDYELRMREEQGNAEERDGGFVETEKYNSQNNDSVDVPSSESNKDNFSDGVQMNEAIKERQNTSSVKPLSKNTGPFTRTAPYTEVFKPKTGTVSHRTDSGDHVLSVNSADHSHNALDGYHAFSQKMDEELVFGSEPAVDNNSSRNEEETRLHNLNENETMRAESPRMAEKGSAESCQFIPYSQPGKPATDPPISVPGLSIQQYVQSAVQHPLHHTQQSAYQPPHRQANQQPATQVVFGPSQPINPSAQVRMPHQLWDLGGSQGGHSTQPAHLRLSEPDPGFSAIPGSGGLALGMHLPPQHFQPPQPPRAPQKLSAKTEVALKKWENEYFEQLESIRGPATDREGYQILQMERNAFGERVHQRIAEHGEVEFMMLLLNMTGRWDLFGHHQTMAPKSTGMKRRLADEEGNEYAGGAAKRNRQH